MITDTINSENDKLYKYPIDFIKQLFIYVRYTE